MDKTQSTILLRDVRAGSTDALSALMEHCAGRLLTIIRLRLGPSLRQHLESQDILQNCLLKALQRVDQFEQDTGASLMAWLARIAENEIRDQAAYYTRQKRHTGREVAWNDGMENVADRVRSLTSDVIRSEATVRLEQALESLDEMHREVIVLRRFEDLSFPEIGRRMNRSPDACRMLFARALTALTLKMRHAP